MKRKFTFTPAFFNPRALIGFRLCLIGLLVGLLGAPSATGQVSGGKITVKYKKFPKGTELPGTKKETVIGFTLQDASQYRYWVDGSKALHTYEFLWWNVNGSLEFQQQVGDTSGASDTFLTAWYIETGPGGPCAPNCSVTTYAFSITEDKVVTDTTPIASVSPPGLWTTPSTSVSTTTTSSSIVITARGTIPTVPPEKFQYWLGLPPALGSTPPPTATNLTVSAGSSGEEAACYQSDAPHPHITPCQSGNPHVNCYQ